MLRSTSREDFGCISKTLQFSCDVSLDMIPLGFSFQDTTRSLHAAEAEKASPPPHPPPLPPTCPRYCSLLLPAGSASDGLPEWAGQPGSAPRSQYAVASPGSARIPSDISFSNY